MNAGPTQSHELTIGSLFAGIGGFDLGFERAGWRTAWQVEINSFNRAVLAERFPHARQFEDVRHVGGHNLTGVDCITAGFPCQDISMAGRVRADKSNNGLRGRRSGLFHEVTRIARELQPTWLVLENVANLLAINDGADFEIVIRSLADCGYVGFWRVLNAAHFGVPQNRRRIFLVCGLGRYPHIDFMADAGPVAAIPAATFAQQQPRAADGFSAYTLTAANAAARINLGAEVLVAHPDGWGEMVERERASSLHGLSLGLDELGTAEAWSAGNAVCPAVAQWVAEILARS